MHAAQLATRTGMVPRLPYMVQESEGFAWMLRKRLARRGCARETGIGYDIFGLQAMALAVSGDGEDPLVTIEVAKTRMCVAVLAKRGRGGGGEIGGALASGFELAEQLIVSPSAGGHQAIGALHAERAVHDRAGDAVIAHDWFG